MTPGARRESGRSGLRLARVDDLLASVELVAKGLGHRQRPLLVDRKAIAPKAALREGRELLGERDGGGEGFAFLDEPVREAHPESLLAAHGASREDHVEGVALT